MALDLRTGQIKWATGVEAFDAWTVACLQQGPHPNCPPPVGPDYDFGSGPNLFTATDRGQTRQLLGAGQKSGTYWAFDPDTGQVVWATKVGPGGVLGGIEWGSATDGERIYVAIANAGKQAWRLEHSGQSVNGGFWSALDATTGRILWQTADPASAIDMGAVTTANGVVYVGSADAVGTMYALDAGNGRILWSFASGGSTICGPAVVDGGVYWGSGYAKTAGFGTTGNNKLYAFAPR